MGGNYGLKLDFDFWCHSGDKSISRKVQHAKTPLIFDKIDVTIAKTTWPTHEETGPKIPCDRRKLNASCKRTRYISFP